MKPYPPDSGETTGLMVMRLGTPPWEEEHSMTITTESACAFSTDPAEQVCEKEPRTGRPARRHFYTEYKRRILAEYEAALTGSKGLVLRREGLYDASVKSWREQFEAGTLGRVSTSTPRRGGD